MIPLDPVAPCMSSPASRNQADPSFLSISAAQGRKRRRDAKDDDAEVAAYEARGRRVRSCSPLPTQDDA